MAQAAALTGFSMGTCRGSTRVSRRVVTRQRVRQSDRYYMFTHSVDVTFQCLAQGHLTCVNLKAST